METLAGVWGAVTEWWASLPPIPELGLPAFPDPDLLIVIATVVLALGVIITLSSWADRRRSRIGLLMTLIAAGLFFWVWEGDREAFGWMSIPEAFVEMAARAVR